MVALAWHLGEEYFDNTLGGPATKVFKWLLEWTQPDMYSESMPALPIASWWIMTIRRQAYPNILILCAATRTIVVYPKLLPPRIMLFVSHIPPLFQRGALSTIPSSPVAFSDFMHESDFKISMNGSAQKDATVNYGTLHPYGPITDVKTAANADHGPESRRYPHKPFTPNNDHFRGQRANENSRRLDKRTCRSLIMTGVDTRSQASGTVALLRFGADTRGGISNGASPAI
ncbi:hypothetical protein F5146DRAFT_997688 [Armillaria mellea]|nr:hypothetical protein F5146DRAFT_997688 [Armillaria mellea]